MINLIKTIVVFQILLIVVSCTTNDKFDGTPESNNLTIETITGTVSSTATFALPGQAVDFTATIPQEFAAMVNDTIDIEAVTKTLGGSLRRATVRLLPGINTINGKVLVGGGGGTFNMPVSLKLNAISLKNAIAGKHFLLTSNEITFDSGDTSVPVDSDSKFQVKVAWENLSTGNQINCKITRLNSVALTLKGSTVSSSNITVMGTQYPITYDTDLTTTASNFVSTHAVTILADKNIIVTSIGKSIFFDNSTDTLPTISIPSGSGTNIGGAIFTSANFAAAGSLEAPRSFSILNSQLASTSTTGIENQLAVYNPGNYKVSISPTVLESTPLDLKYRIIIKKPDGTTLIYNGTYNQATSTSGFIDILKFTKEGLGDDAVYSNIIQL